MRLLLALLLFVSSVSACSADHRDDPGSDGGTTPAIDLEWLPGVTATALTTDTTHLYLGGGTLARVPLAGGTPETLYTVPATTNDELSAIDKIVVGPTDIVFVQSTLSVTTQALQLALIRVPLAGGAPTTLATSSDQRAFLGVTIAGTDVIYSTFTAIYRVPLAGGPSKFIAQSPRSIRYWIFTPTVVGENLVWAEGGEMFSIPLSRTGEGTALASLPATGRIIGGDASSLVVTLSLGIANQVGATSFIAIDPATGATQGPLVALGREVDDAIATESDVWAASWDGVVRAPRDGSAPQLLTTEPAFVVAVSSDAVFTSTNAGIARIAR